MEQFLFTTYSKEEFANVIKDVLKCELLTTKSETSLNQKDNLISRKETSKLLNISLVTLNDWTKKGMIPAYRIGRLVRYKEAEVYDSLTRIKKYGRKD